MKNCEYLGKGISSPLMLGGRYTAAVVLFKTKISYYLMFSQLFKQVSELTQSFLKHMEFLGSSLAKIYKIQTFYLFD